VGVGSKNRKIVWVAWHKVCESKDKGGLGVIDIRKFNLTLMGKWIWKRKSEKRSLWKNILDSKYDGWRGLRSQVQNYKESLWWRDIRKVWNLEEWGNDFEDRGRWEVGDGKEIRFWEDKWVDNVPLKHKFPRLFSISLNTGHHLTQVGIWSNNSWSWELSWRRNDGRMHSFIVISLVDWRKLHGLQRTKSSLRACGFLEGEG